MREVAIGRFRVALPDQLEVASRRQSIYGVTVRTAPLGDVSIEEHWKALRARRGPEAREIPFPDHARGLWYAPYPAVPSNVVLEAMRPMGDHAVWLTRPATAGKEDPAERLTAKLLSVYAPGTAFGFCAEQGSIRMEGSLTEATALSLVHKTTPGVKVEMETKTVISPDTSTLSSLTEERLVMKAAGGTLDVRSQRDRTIAGMTGKEFRVAIAPPGETAKLRYTWQFSGEPRNPARPHINIGGTAEAATQTALDSGWEDVLGSLASVPMEAPR